MSTDKRTWRTDGLKVRGTAPGLDEIVYAPTRYGQSPGVTDELREVAVKLADLLNGHAHLSANERAVLHTVLEHQARHPWPASIGVVAEQTGLTRKTVHDIYDRLVELGLGTRPPQLQGEVRPRPFQAFAPGEKRTPMPIPEETR